MLAGLIFLGGCGPAAARKPLTPAARKPLTQLHVINHRLQVLGFYAPGPPDTLAAVLKYPKAIGAFVPFWYSVKADGSLISRVDTKVLNEIRAKHIPITPLVNDHTGKQTFLRNNATLVKAARNIADMVGAMHYQGVHIDFEPPVNALSPELTKFMTDLRDFLPHQDMITVSIVPHSGGAYNYKKLAPEVNQFVLMAYDQHADGSHAGPVAAVAWVQNIVKRLEKQLPGSKILLGVALYGYDWPNGSTHALTVPFSQITPAMKKNAKWSDRYQESYAHIGNHTYWWESLQGMNEKIQIARRDKLAGVALWRLGYQNNAVMQLLLHQIGAQR